MASEYLQRTRAANRAMGASGRAKRRRDAAGTIGGAAFIGGAALAGGIVGGIPGAIGSAGLAFALANPATVTAPTKRPRRKTTPGGR